VLEEGIGDGICNAGWVHEFLLKVEGPDAMREKGLVEYSAVISRAFLWMGREGEQMIVNGQCVPP
jgi:hypothetical protein